MEYLQRIDDNLSSISKLNFSPDPITSEDALKSVSQKRIRQATKEDIVVFNDLIPPPPKSIFEKYGDNFENFSPIEKLQLLESTYHQKVQWIQTVIDLCHLDHIKHESDLVQKEYENHLRFLNQHKLTLEKANLKHSEQKSQKQTPDNDNKELLFEIKHKDKKNQELKEKLSQLKHEIFALKQTTPNRKQANQILSTGSSHHNIKNATEYRDRLRKKLYDLNNKVKAVDNEMSSLI